MSACGSRHTCRRRDPAPGAARAETATSRGLTPGHGPACRRWAEQRGHDYRVVFEGEDESADDRIVRETAELDRYWLVTSDRELRERAGERAERVIGGGAFIRELIGQD